MSQAQLIKLLWLGDMNCTELAEESGLHYVTVLDYTRALYRAGASHIVRRDADSRGRHTTKIYKLGPGKDAPPIRTSTAERTKRYRDKRRLALQLGLLNPPTEEGRTPCVSIKPSVTPPQP